jgi:hypothetical protein
MMNESMKNMLVPPLTNFQSLEDIEYYTKAN